MTILLLLERLKEDTQIVEEDKKEWVLQRNPERNVELLGSQSFMCYQCVMFLFMLAINLLALIELFR